MIELLLLVVCFGLILICAIFVAAEFSLITVNRSTIERQAASGEVAAQGVLAALKTLSQQLSGAQVGITITNLALGYLAEPAVSSFMHDPLVALGLTESAVRGVGVVIVITLATLLMMLFGELIPKNLALARPAATAKLVERPQRWFTKFMSGPINILNSGANKILLKFGVEPQEELASARSADELLSLVKRSAEKGTLPRETARLVERSLSFSEYTAADIMTPRVRVQSIKADETVLTGLKLVRETGISRFPVIGKSVDDVLGVVHIKQLIAVKYNKRANTLIKQIMEKPVIVPSSIPLDSLFDELSKSRTSTQMGVVIDEFGGTDGIVTVEDIIEEIVGEVDDEHDKPHLSISKKAAGQWVISGLLRPDEIASELGIYLPDEDDFDTVAGLVSDRLEHMPKQGESVIVRAVDRSGVEKRVKLTVLQMDKRRIDKIRLAIVGSKKPEFDI